MGIFKKTKAKGEEANDNDKGAAHMHVSPESRTVSGTTEDGIKIESPIPDDVDIKNPKQMTEFLKKMLQEKGIIPKDAKVEALDLGEPGVVEKLFADIHDLTASNKRASAPADLPIPQDPTKASFIQAMNRLHKMVHQMIPVMGELTASMKCLSLNVKASNLKEVEVKAFAKFESEFARMLLSLAKFGEHTCSFVEHIEKREIPVPDSASTTIN